MIRRAQAEDLQDILDIYNDAIVNTTAVYDYAPRTLENERIFEALHVCFQLHCTRTRRNHGRIVRSDDDGFAGAV